MGTTFEIFVQISGQKFSVCLNEEKPMITFFEIYPKLKQVVKIGVNEDIDFLTHDFETIEHGAVQGSAIQLTEHLIHNLSLISIRAKPEVSHTYASRGPVVSASHTNSEQRLQISSDESSVHMRLQIASINSRLITKAPEVLFPTVLSERLSSAPIDSQVNNCQNQNQRLQEVPHPRKDHNIVNNSSGKEAPKAQQVVSPSKGSNRRPVLKASSASSLLSKRFQESLQKVSELKKSAIPKTAKVDKDFDACVLKLKDNEKNINAFNSMVTAMNIGWNFMDNGPKYWKILADKMSATDTRYEFIVTSDICKTRFYIWTQFYAQNYEKLNGKLEFKVQKIFDCLKIVHTLDLTQLFPSHSYTYQKIKSISLRKDLKDYYIKHLNFIRIGKLATKEIDRDNCQTLTVPIVRPKNFKTHIPVVKPKSPIKVTINTKSKSENNVRKAIKSPSKSGKGVSSQKSGRNELNYIPLIRPPDPRVRKETQRLLALKDKRTTKPVAKPSTDSRPPTTDQIKSKPIETIVLD